RNIGAALTHRRSRPPAEPSSGFISVATVSIGVARCPLRAHHVTATTATATIPISAMRLDESTVDALRLRRLRALSNSRRARVHPMVRKIAIHTARHLLARIATEMVAKAAKYRALFRFGRGSRISFRVQYQGRSRRIAK